MSHPSVSGRAALQDPQQLHLLTVAKMLPDWVNGVLIWSQEGQGAVRVVEQGTTGVDSSLVVGIWEGMAKRVAKEMFPICIWRGFISTP